MRKTAALVILAYTYLAMGQSPQTQTAPQPEIRTNLQDLDWFPSGKQIAFSAIRAKTDWSDYEPEKWSIYVINQDGSGLRKLHDHALYVAISPDGNHAAFGLIEKQNWDIVVMNLKDHKIKKLTTGPAKDMAPCWSPDGKRLAFMSDRDGTSDIYVMNADGSGVKRLTMSDKDRSYNPDWSPDGKRIVYYLEKGDDKDQIYIISTDGGEADRISDQDSHNIFPGWTPAGRVLFIATTEKGSHVNYEMNADGSNRKSIPYIEGFFARYSPDGAQLAYIRETKEAGLYVVQADGTNPRRILDFVRPLEESSK